MSSKNSFVIALFPGDGIGPEITPFVTDLVHQACKKAGITCDFESLAAGATHYAEYGESLPAKTMDFAKQADAILLACMGMPHIRYPDGREIAPQIELREQLDLYAGVRPVKTLAGLPLPLGDKRAQALDFVVIRESTEGLFASREKGTLVDDEIATDLQVITRKGSERLFKFAFKQAQSRQKKGHKGLVTCVDKANVLKSFYFFRKIFDEVSAQHPQQNASHLYVDAAALQLVRQPWMFDVLVTENMFGDILSDLCAGLMGGMGMAPSADIGDEHAVFQPCHGSAPDILGTGKANPTAMFLSAALMLDWLGEKHQCSGASKAADLINRAVEQAYAKGDLLPYEFSGSDGTQAIYQKISLSLDNQP